MVVFLLLIPETRKTFRAVLSAPKLVIPTLQGPTILLEETEAVATEGLSNEGDADGAKKRNLDEICPTNQTEKAEGTDRKKKKREDRKVTMS